ncbi:MAG: copper chaperone CopZ [Neolewinella sp.]|jgi:copper chaperone CopZ
MRVLAILAVLFAFTAMAAPPKKASIQTNAVCEMCQFAIEKALFKIDGVKKAELDLVTKKVKIKYDESVVDLATLRQAISAVGYDADDVPARPAAREALDDCCKGDGKACKKPE